MCYCVYLILRIIETWLCVFAYIYKMHNQMVFNIFGNQPVSGDDFWKRRLCKTSQRNFGLKEQFFVWSQENR